MTIHKYPRKKGRISFFSLLTAVFFLTSCQKQPNLRFGNQYTNDNNGSNVVVVDTSTVLVSTIYSDSTFTDGTGYLMAGTYKDPSLGTVTSRAFFQVAPPAGLPSLSPVNNTYDSIGLVVFFKKNNPWYGDTTSQQNYVVNQVDSSYQLSPPFLIGYSSNNSLPVDPTPLGQTGPIYIHPTALDSFPLTSQGISDTIKIRLDDKLGRQLYNMVYTLSDSINNPTSFQNWFHGLCLSTDGIGSGGTGAIYGFKDSCLMRIYYRTAGVFAQQYIDFNITNRSLAFNSIRTNYANTPLVNIRKPTGAYNQTPPATSSKVTGNAGYIQSITGLNVRLSFPTIKAIALRPDYIGLLRATLTVRPVPDSWSTTWRLAPQIGVYTTDQNNLLGTPVPAAGISGAQTGALNVDYFNPQNAVYAYDVTSFVQAVITNNASNADSLGLILSVPPPNNVADFRRVVIADQSYQVNQRTTLSVYYISLFPHN
ncbi:MAG TPA: DUF4270 family protein [Puia sp.]|jgi:hypothetical protein